MKTFTTTITHRGQVTIPAEVRRALGLKPRDKVASSIEGGIVRLAAAASSLESAYGSVNPARKPENFEEISRAAKDSKTESAARRLEFR